MVGKDDKLTCLHAVSDRFTHCTRGAEKSPSQLTSMCSGEDEVHALLRWEWQEGERGGLD